MWADSFGTSSVASGLLWLLLVDFPLAQPGREKLDLSLLAVGNVHFERIF